jgi:hypothetical protein
MASLIDLPAELLSRIASHLFCSDPAFHDAYEDYGFCSLRLSCRGIEAKTRYAFERAAFSTVAVTLHARSLQRLHNIASQVRAGRLIKKLVFAKAFHQIFDQTIATSESVRQHEYASYGVIELPRDGDDGVYPNDGLTLKERVHFGLQDVFAKIVALTPNLRGLVIERNFMASFWLDSPSRQDQLNEMAQRTYHSPIEEDHDHGAYNIHEDAGSDSSSDPSSDSEMYSLHGDNRDYDDDNYMDPYHIEVYVYPDYLLYLIAIAAHRRGIRFSSLSSNNSMSSSVRVRTFVELFPALQSLQHLDISMNVESITKLVRRDGSALQDFHGKPVADSLGRALGRLRSLQTLKLSFDDEYWEDDRLPMMAKSLGAINQQFLERLTTIDIENAYFEDKSMYHFLQKQQSVLRKLCLHFVILPTMGDWRLIFALLLGEAPELLELACSRLLAHDRSEVLFSFETFTGWKKGSWMQCCGRGKIAVELQRALDSFSSNSC